MTRFNLYKSAQSNYSHGLDCRYKHFNQFLIKQLSIIFLGLQKVDGIVGGLVIRRPQQQDPNGRLYDFDLPSHLIVVQDWYHKTADALFPGLRFNDTQQMAMSYLINGRGIYDVC